MASSSYDKTIRIWEVSTGKEVKKLEGDTYGVRSVAYSPDGKLLVSGSDDKTICIWKAGINVNLIPSLLEPTNGSAISTDKVTLKWAEVPLALDYTVQISRDKDFNDIVFEKSVYSEETTVDMVCINLYWRVRGNGLLNEPTLWSPVWLFKSDAPVVYVSLKGSKGLTIEVDILIDRAKNVYGECD